MKEQEEELWNQEPYVTQPKEAKQKKSNTKRTITIIVIVIIALMSLLTALAMKKIMPLVEVSQNKAKYREEGYIEQDVTQYLQERYGEEFVIESIRGRSYAYDYINMYAYPKDYQDESHKFKIQGRYNDKGILEYCDSYVMIKLRDDYEAYVDPIIDEYFDEYKFYMTFDSEWITSNVPADATLEDLWGLRANIDYPLPTLCIFFGVKEEKRYNEGELKLIMESLREKNFRGCVETLIFFDEELYSKVTPENNHDILDGQTSKYDGNVIFIYDNKVEY